MATAAAGRLHINAEASGGRVTAALLDEDGSVLEGFSTADCNALTSSDALDHTVEWKGDLSSLADRTVRIHLTLADAELFSLWWSDDR